MGIIILLIVALLLVVKFCKKTLKLVLSILIILVTLYCVMIFIDKNRVESFREPIFAVSSELKDYGDYSREVYKGFGYRVEINKGENQNIISITMYLFNKVISGFIT